MNLTKTIKKIFNVKMVNGEILLFKTWVAIDNPLLYLGMK